MTCSIILSLSHAAFQDSEAKRGISLNELWTKELKTKYYGTGAIIIVIMAVNQKQEK